MLLCGAGTYACRAETHLGACSGTRENSAPQAKVPAPQSLK
jgi:hypothetical protein